MQSNFFLILVQQFQKKIDKGVCGIGKSGLNNHLKRQDITHRQAVLTKCYEYLGVENIAEHQRIFSSRGYIKILSGFKNLLTGKLRWFILQSIQ